MGSTGREWLHGVELGHSGGCKSQGKLATTYHCTQVKCGRMDTPRNLQAGAFAGTAEAYFRYRPPYPKRALSPKRTCLGRPFFLTWPAGRDV